MGLSRAKHPFLKGRELNLCPLRDTNRYRPPGAKMVVRHRTDHDLAFSLLFAVGHPALKCASSSPN